jgi:intracellular multiplication protein IcmC
MLESADISTMLSVRLQFSLLCCKSRKFFLAFLSSFAIVHSAYALDFSNVNPRNLNAATFISNLGKSIPNLMQLVTAVAYVMGMFFVINGLFHLKKYGEQRSQASGEAHLKGPLIYLFVGAALLYLPSTVRVGLSTFWTSPYPYQYQTDQGGPWAELLKAGFMIIQLIGTISFIRGLVMLTHLGGASAQQQGTLGKALAHIIAGILCIDLYDFLKTVFNTLALGS